MTRKRCEIHTKKQNKGGFIYLSIIVNTMTHNGAKIISEFKAQKIFCKPFDMTRYYVSFSYVIKSMLI